MRINRSNKYSVVLYELQFELQLNCYELLKGVINE